MQINISSLDIDKLYDALTIASQSLEQWDDFKDEFTTWNSVMHKYLDSQFDDQSMEYQVINYLLHILDTIVSNSYEAATTLMFDDIEVSDTSNDEPPETCEI